LIHPRGQLPVKLASQIVPNQIVFAVLAFMFLYLACLVALTFVLLLSGMDFISALTAVLACMNTIGPGLNQIGPASTYAGLSDFQTWVCTFSMLLGRLEVFTLLVVLTPSFWRK
jgi:trk system potassium uptake protein TrkH